MMRRCLLAAATRARQAAGAQQGLAELFATSSAAAAGSELAAPLLRRCSSATARHCQQHALLPPAAAAACAGHGTAAALAAAAPRPAAALAVQRRGYAQLGTKMPRSGYKPPAEMHRAMQMRLSMVSANLLAEPYRGVPPRLPLKAYVTVAGWKEVWRRFMSQVKSLFTLAKCQKLIPGFKRKTFKEESLQLYKQVCGLLAQGDKTELRQVVTPAVFSDMKRQLKQREDGGWARVQWDIVKEPTADEITTVHGRLIMIDPKDDTTGFAQLTVCIPSQQRFAAYDRRGILVAGDPEKPIDVEDYWVFEHALKKSPANRWRLAGRLSILPHAVEQRAQPEAAAAQQVQQKEPELRMGHITEQQRPLVQQKPAARQAAAGRGRR